MSRTSSGSFSNHNRVHPTNVNYFQGSPYRQYGSGIGAAIKAGLRGFVIPMVKRYGLPVAKSFLTQAAPEVLNILDGTTKSKTAMKNAVKKTIRQQIGGGRRRTKRKPASKNKRKKTSKKKRPSYAKSNKSNRRFRKRTSSKKSKKTFKRKRSQEPAGKRHKKKK